MTELIIIESSELSNVAVMMTQSNGSSDAS